jgi:hypothetical protein
MMFSARNSRSARPKVRKKTVEEKQSTKPLVPVGGLNDPGVRRAKKGGMMNKGKVMDKKGRAMKRKSKDARGRAMRGK